MMKKAGTILAALLLVSSFQSMAQQHFPRRLPAARTERELRLEFEAKRAPEPSSFGKAVIMPPNVRYPGEYEESQAVAISWAHDYDANFNIIGVDTYSIYGYISAQCAKYISDELPVWIRVPFAQDTNTIKIFMQSLGWPLTHNYRFFVTTGDDWWMRDFGPNGIYYGSQDSVGFVDVKYYEGRDYDNVFPAYLASQLNYPNYISAVNAEGGNLVTDGFGKLFFSNMVTYFNGLTGVHSPVWNSAKTLDTMKALFNATTLYNLTRLNCDGGTAHIDLYFKLVDEQTMLVAQYPSVITAGDRQIIEDNYQLFAGLQSTYNRPFRIYRIPHPTGDDGTYTRVNCAQVNFDARTFVNGITFNKTYLYPSYSDGVTGNQAQTDSVTRLFRKIMKGYKVIPIDSRAITTNGGGGAIHCITMQIPAENPVLFWHPSVDGLQPFRTSFHIVARITNRSGIGTAVCRWQMKGKPGWNTVSLSDSSGYFVGDIQAPDVTDNDFIVYYLEATTNNGKTAVKPITAPEGFYTIYFKAGADITEGVGEEQRIVMKDHLFGAYPNPAGDRFSVPFHLTQSVHVRLDVTDITGKVVYSVDKGMMAPGSYVEDVNTDRLGNGLYFYSLSLDGSRLDTRRVMINR